MSKNIVGKLFKVSEPQVKLMKKWMENDKFWSGLSINQRDVVVSAHKIKLYGEKARKVLNDVRESWMHYKGISDVETPKWDILESTSKYIVSCDFAKSYNDYSSIIALKV